MQTFFLKGMFSTAWSESLNHSNVSCVQHDFRNSPAAEINLFLLTYSEVFLILKCVRHQFTYIIFTMMYIVSYIHTRIVTLFVP
jgi:hypothetical protein